MNKKQLVAKNIVDFGQSKLMQKEYRFNNNYYFEYLKNDETVKIAGFGTYKVAKEKLRVEEIPELRESIQIAASKVGVFTC